MVQKIKSGAADITTVGAVSGVTAASGDASTLLASTAFVDVMRDVPSVAVAASYTITLLDRGKSIDFTGGVSQTITIPANATVAFPIGSVVTITNNSANSLAVAITTDTMRQAGTANVGGRVVSAYGVATARKVASTTWIISGSGLS